MATARNFVSIFLQGEMHYGKVISAANYKDFTPDAPDNWYIEFQDVNCGAMYLKQIEDGYADAAIKFYETEAEMLQAVLDE